MVTPEQILTSDLPPIPAKRYFTIGEVSDLCGVKPHVLRYWEQEFTQLKPLKRRGNRRYYQHHEVLLVRRIRELLYEHGYTINGARNKLDDPVEAQKAPGKPETSRPGTDPVRGAMTATPAGSALTLAQIRSELTAVLALLAGR
jgi:DNA-binding transcriptional MerR regulator